jgi:hypothetical protein
MRSRRVPVAHVTADSATGNSGHTGDRVYLVTVGGGRNRHERRNFSLGVGNGGPRGPEKGDVRSTPRQLIRTYVPAALHNKLQQYAAKKGVSKSSVNHAALARYLDDTNHDQAILRKLDRIERNQEHGQRDSEFFVEAFAVFVQVWMAHTPRLADADKPSAEQSALQRFREYTEHVVEKLADGGTFFADQAREHVVDNDGGPPEPTAQPRGGSR